MKPKLYLELMKKKNKSLFSLHEERKLRNIEVGVRTKLKERQIEQEAKLGRKSKDASTRFREFKKTT